MRPLPVTGADHDVLGRISRDGRGQRSAIVTQRDWYCGARATLPAEYAALASCFLQAVTRPRLSGSVRGPLPGVVLAPPWPAGQVLVIIARRRSCGRTCPRGQGGGSFVAGG